MSLVIVQSESLRALMGKPRQGRPKVIRQVGDRGLQSSASASSLCVFN